MNIELLIIGSDLNAYYMARCYYEEYHKKANLIGLLPMPFTNNSKILNIEYNDKIHTKEGFLEAVNNFYNNHSKDKILLVGSNDNYVRLIIENQEELKDKFYFQCFNEELLNNLLVKENFYTKFKDIDIPETYIYNINDKLDMKRINEINYPIIVKPSDGIEYHEHEFKDQHKVYKLLNETELLETIDKIRESGYSKNLIIQKFIKGDDSYLFDCVMYVDRNSKCILSTFAQIGLQEHTITGIGNATVLVNGFNKYNNTEKTVEKLKKFIEKSGYHGFCEFDLKYDSDDNKFKVLEINPRQARSSYYLCFGGYNLVKILISDLIEKKDLRYEHMSKELCWTVVPKIVINKYVLDKELKEEINKLYKENKVINPLEYKEDNSFKRRKWLILRSLKYIKKYKENKW